MSKMIDVRDTLPLEDVPVSEIGDWSTYAGALRVEARKLRAAVRAEREACAKVNEEHANAAAGKARAADDIDRAAAQSWQWIVNSLRSAAAAIRARGGGAAPAQMMGADRSELLRRVEWAEGNIEAAKREEHARLVGLLSEEELRLHGQNGVHVWEDYARGFRGARRLLEKDSPAALPPDPFSSDRGAAWSEEAKRRNPPDDSHLRKDSPQAPETTSAEHPQGTGRDAASRVPGDLLCPDCGHTKCDCASLPVVGTGPESQSGEGLRSPRDMAQCRCNHERGMCPGLYWPQGLKKHLPPPPVAPTAENAALADVAKAMAGFPPVAPTPSEDHYNPMGRREGPENLPDEPTPKEVDAVLVRMPIMPSAIARWHLAETTKLREERDKWKAMYENLSRNAK